MSQSNAKRSSAPKRRRNSNLSNLVNPNNTLKSFTPTIKCKKRFRFVANAAATKVDLRDTDLMFLLGVASTTANLNPIFGSARLRRIEMWAPGPATPSVAFVAVEYKGNNPNFGNDSVIHSSNSASSMQYAYVSSTPPRDSYAASWLYPSGYNLCQLSCPKGTIVDVTLEFTLLDDTPPFTDPSVSSGLSPSYLYCHTLTGQNSPNVFLPQGWNAAC